MGNPGQSYFEIGWDVIKSFRCSSKGLNPFCLEAQLPAGLGLSFFSLAYLQTIAMQPLPSLRSAARYRYSAQLPFFGLVFMLPGVVGPNLPAGFAPFAAYDLATGLLAILALLTVRLRSLFWLFVVAFNLVGVGDLVLDYYHASQVGLPELSGQLGAAYLIPIIYVPILMITHIVALYWLVRPQPNVARDLASDATAS